MDFMQGEFGQNGRVCRNYSLSLYGWLPFKPADVENNAGK